MNTNNLHFETLEDWNNFKIYLVKRNRFVLDQKQEKFIQSVIHIAETRNISIKQGEVWYRARRSIQNYSVKPLKKDNKAIYGKFPAKKEEVYAPPHDLAQEGRANPRRLSMLYLAQDEITAMTEVRPYLTEQLTCASFKIDRDLRVVDLRAKPFDAVSRNQRYSKQSQKKIMPKELEDHVWEDIGHNFSRPTDPNDSIGRYVPTQYIAAAFSNAGFDGIIYSSSLKEDGVNLVLFDRNAAFPFVGKIFYTKKLEFDFIISGEPVEYN